MADSRRYLALLVDGPEDGNWLTLESASHEVRLNPIAVSRELRLPPEADGRVALYHMEGDGETLVTGSRSTYQAVFKFVGYITPGTAQQVGGELKEYP